MSATPCHFEVKAINKTQTQRTHVYKGQQVRSTISYNVKFYAPSAFSPFFTLSQNHRRSNLLYATGVGVSGHSNFPHFQFNTLHLDIVFFSPLSFFNRVSFSLRPPSKTKTTQHDTTGRENRSTCQETQGELRARDEAWGTEHAPASGLPRPPGQVILIWVGFQSRLLSF